jgi:hypothetical protein
MSMIQRFICNEYYGQLQLLCEQKKTVFGETFLCTVVVEMDQYTNMNLVKDTNELVHTFQFNFKQQHI